MSPSRKQPEHRRLSVVLKPEERKVIREAAFTAEVSTSEFIRRAALQAAQKKLRKAS